MNSQLDHNHREVLAMHTSALVLATLFSLTVLLTGCDAAGDAAGGSATGVADQIAGFLAHFARQVLAAWLL